MPQPETVLLTRTVLLCAAWNLFLIFLVNSHVYIHDDLITGSLLWVELCLTVILHNIHTFSTTLSPSKSGFGHFQVECTQMCFMFYLQVGSVALNLGTKNELVSLQNTNCRISAAQMERFVPPSMKRSFSERYIRIHRWKL